MCPQFYSVLHILFWLLKRSQLIHSQTLHCGTCWFGLIVLFNLQLENDILQGCPMSPIHNLSVKFLYTVFKSCSQSDIIPSLLYPGETAVEAQEQTHVTVVTFPPEQPLKPWQGRWVDKAVLSLLDFLCVIWVVDDCDMGRDQRNYTFYFSNWEKHHFTDAILHGATFLS